MSIQTSSRRGDPNKMLTEASEWEPEAEGREQLRHFDGVVSKSSAYRIAPVALDRLIDDHPYLREPVIDGLLRRGETANIIAPTKANKTWLSYELMLCVLMGIHWLGRLACTPGRVLLIDNELHPSTIAHRVPIVARALGIDRKDYADRLDVISLRGRLMDLYALGGVIRGLPRGVYSAAVSDAWYRLIPPGVSENDNAAVAAMYNAIDGYAEHLGAAWINIHHTSKGTQGDRAVTDVGAGAGSQSRAADAHLVPRPHEEEGVVVMESAVRSFAPMEPMPLRWEWPLWRPDITVDASRLRGRLTKQEERQTDRDREGMDAIVEALQAGPATPTEVRRRVGGMNRERAQRLLDRLEQRGDVRANDITKRGNPTREYHLSEGRRT